MLIVTDVPGTGQQAARGNGKPCAVAHSDYGPENGQLASLEEHEAHLDICKPCSVSQSVSSVRLFNSTTPVLFRLCCFACVVSPVRGRSSSRSSSSDYCVHSHAFCNVRNIRSLFDTKVDHAIKKRCKQRSDFSNVAKSKGVDAITNCIGLPARGRSSSSSSNDYCVHSHACCDIRNSRSLFDTKVDHGIKKTL